MLAICSENGGDVGVFKVVEELMHVGESETAAGEV